MSIRETKGNNHLIQEFNMIQLEIVKGMNFYIRGNKKINNMKLMKISGIEGVVI